MVKAPERPAGEGFGCFLLLVLGAVLTMGVLVAIERSGAAWPHDLGEGWPWLVAWIAIPGAGIALIALAVFGFRVPGGPKRPGTSGRRRG